MPTKLILVVEDEPLLRMTAVDALEEEGFEAIEAANSMQALELLERRDDVGLVFSDIEMGGGVDGLRLAALVRDRWPWVPVVLTSGRFALEPHDLPEGCLFVPKPYRLPAVTEVFRKLSRPG